MDPGGSDGALTCYYSVLGLRRPASPADIRAAYRKLALKWHPDRWVNNPARAAGDAKRRFQQIQEAYSVLSDEGKKAIYDAGLYDSMDGENEGFSDFMQEMLSMMDNVGGENDSFEDLQKMFMEMVSDDCGTPNSSRKPSQGSSRPKPKRFRMNTFQVR